jgi:hypothetical protein
LLYAIFALPPSAPKSIGELTDIEGRIGVKVKVLNSFDNVPGVFLLQTGFGSIDRDASRNAGLLTRGSTLQAILGKFVEHQPVAPSS